MFARKTNSKNGTSIPQDWLESFARLLNETYKKECDQAKRYFDVYGQIYPEELLIVVSWLSEENESLAPVSCFLSCEKEDMNDEKRVKETQNNYIEVVGLFFDEIFSDAEWDQFEPNWQEVSFKNHTYFYKLSRENINLTLEANRLLGPDLEEDEDDDYKH